VVCRRYYKRQDELITAFEGIDLESLKPTEENMVPSKNRRLALIMAKVSFFINLVRFLMMHFSVYCRSISTVRLSN